MTFWRWDGDASPPHATTPRNSHERVGPEKAVDCSWISQFSVIAGLKSFSRRWTSIQAWTKQEHSTSMKGFRGLGVGVGRQIGTKLAGWMTLLVTMGFWCLVISLCLLSSNGSVLIQKHFFTFFAKKPGFFWKTGGFTTASRKIWGVVFFSLSVICPKVMCRGVLQPKSYIIFNALELHLKFFKLNFVTFYLHNLNFMPMWSKYGLIRLC